MKGLQTLLALALLGACLAYETPGDDYPEFIYTENSDGEIVKEYLTGTPRDGEIATDAIMRYYYFSRSQTSVLFQAATIANLRNTDFDPSRETVFVIHGWTNSNSSGINRQIRTALLDNHDVNVIVVDWSRISRLDYVTAQANVKRVAQLTSNIVLGLERQFHLNLDRVTIVGFSLGAHVAGIIGKTCNARIGQIVGLDPAGPLFTLLGKSGRLDSSDAKFVQVIHTNSGTLGIRHSIGDVDFWPNGGSTQSGCLLDLTGICSHNRVFALYAESVKNRNRLNARACGSYANYKLNLCLLRESSLLGGHPIDKSVSGDFFLDTNALSPYGRG